MQKNAHSRSYVLKYDEVEDVCSELKMGISGVDADDEHMETFVQVVSEFFHLLVGPWICIDGCYLTNF